MPCTADELRRQRWGETVTYVVNRNINYTNQCYFRCGFCGFSRGPKSLNLRGEPYILEVHEVVHRSVEAWERGATEVCLQGGIHPDFTGDFYASVLEAIKARLPEMHVHGFTPLEVWQGAHTLGVSVRDFLARLRDAGLGTLPGTAAEILDDRVRAHLCPDKVRTAEWAEVMITAHELGLRATTTMMFGHIDGPRAWANHLEVLRRIQRRTGGFTEFVPLPFVHMASPIFLQGKARPGPTWDEVVLVHAVGRIALAGLIDNIQASWVKLGLDGGARLLAAGCNDLGGTLMDENISRASGASHGQLATPEELEAAIRSAGRVPARRNTVYELIGAGAPSPLGLGRRPRLAVALALVQRVEHLLHAAELDPRPVARGAPALLLEQVDQLPVVVGDEVVAALGQQALEHGPARHLLLVEAPLRRGPPGACARSPGSRACWCR